MGLESFNKACRPSLFEELSRGTLDLLVIGGGITGASIFRDAALRGLRVGLAEARDFASATSGRSSKLIHGGLRYLRNLGLRLAWESCHERNLHVRLNKRLVRPIPFLLPLYKGRGPSRAVLRVGMLLYEALSGLGNYRIHRFLSREETLLLAPGIPGEDLVGGCLYYDAVVSDSRWTVEIVKDGVRHGGLSLNYAPVTALVKQQGRVCGARVRDRLGGKDYEVQARAVVNATGIFSDRIRALDGEPDTAPRRLSKGTHLVFAEEDVPLSVTTVFASPLDERPLFLVKREGCFLYGTSDDWEEAAPGEPVPGERDVSYLLESLARFMPQAALGWDKVRFVYSGFRPLVAEGGEMKPAPSDASREDVIEVSTSGLIHVSGGKLTTARLMALRVLDRVLECTGGRPAWKPCSTHRHSIGGTNEAVAEALSYWVRQCPRLAGYFRTLFERYGLDAHQICPEVLRIFRGQHPDAQAEPIRAEVEYVCRCEMVCTVEDLMDRRAGFLHWDAATRLERLLYGAHVVRAELGLSEEAFAEQVEAYKRHLERFHSLPRLG